VCNLEGVICGIRLMFLYQRSERGGRICRWCSPESAIADTDRILLQSRTGSALTFETRAKLNDKFLDCPLESHWNCSNCLTENIRSETF
jgi:hypothetical protein